MIRLTRRYRFPASHRLHAESLTEAENRDLYGKCNHPFGHGHDYELEVSVRGPIDPVTGRAAEPAALDRYVQARVLDAFGYRNLNGAMPGLVPTTENLANEIRRRLAECWQTAFPGPWPKLDRVRIHETKRNVFETTE